MPRPKLPIEQKRHRVVCTLKTDDIDYITEMRIRKGYVTIGEVIEEALLCLRREEL